MGAANLCHRFYNCDLFMEEELTCKHFRRNYYLYDSYSGYVILYQIQQYSVKLSHYVLYDFVTGRNFCDYCL